MIKLKYSLEFEIILSESLYPEDWSIEQINEYENNSALLVLEQKILDNFELPIKVIATKI